MMLRMTKGFRAACALLLCTMLAACAAVPKPARSDDAVVLLVSIDGFRAGRKACPQR